MKASIFGFDFKTGIKKWEYLENLSSETNFTFNSDKVIFVDTQGRLLAINRESGKIDWINKEIRWNQAILYIPVSANQFFLYNDTENVTGNFFALINIDTGKFIKKELVMLNNTDQMMLIRSMLGVNPQDQTRYFFLFSSNNQYFLSLWDLDDMKEIWRLSLGKWDNYIDLESFLEIKFDPSIPENVILSCKRNTLNAIDPTPKEEDQILDGEYLIDMTSGKIVFQFLVPTIDPIKNESKLYELDYKNHCIKWAIIIKGAEVEERSEAYSKSRIFLLKRWTENEKIIEDGFLELNPQNGNILAYYPKNKDEEKMYYCFSINQFRFFYSNEEDSLLQMQTDY